MKKIKYLLLSLLVLIVLPLSVSAASGTIKVTGTSQVVVGNRVTLTVTLSSPNAPMISWEMNLNYDSNYLELVSTNSENNGTKMVNSSATGTNKKLIHLHLELKKLVRLQLK